MLILSRHAGESIVIGEGPQAVRVLVTAVAEGNVRLGIEAPREVAVWREELGAAGRQKYTREEAADGR